MPYTPPSGYVERIDDPADENSRVSERFHADPDCPRVKTREALIPVQRPGSAPRCSLCASS